MGAITPARICSTVKVAMLLLSSVTIRQSSIKLDLGLVPFEGRGFNIDFVDSRLKLRI